MPDGFCLLYVSACCPDVSGWTHYEAPLTNQPGEMTMTKRNNTAKANAAQTGMQTAMDELMTEAENTAPETTETETTENTTKPAKKATKPKTTRATKAKTENKTEEAPKEEAKAEDTKEAPEKPEPVTIDGIEVAEGVNPSDVKAKTDAVKASLDAIQRKDSDLLSSYLAFGEFQSSVSKMFKSTKQYGQYLANALPETQAFDPALRSNCKWLWEALHVDDHEASDLLARLGLNGQANDYEAELAKFKSANPTVIKREYKALVKADEKVAKAKELGVEPEEVDKAEKESTKAEETAKIEEAIENLNRILMQQKSKQAIADEACDVMREVFGKSKKDAIDYVNSL